MAGGFREFEFKQKTVWFLLGILILFHILNNAIILRHDNTPLLWDGGDYFYRSLRYYDVLAHPAAGFFSRFNEISTYRPPLFLLTSFPFYLILGRSPDAAVMTNALYLIILILSVYGIGKTMHGRSAGLLGAFAVSFFPILFGMSRNYWVDFALTAMVALSLYFLVQSDGFRNRRWSLLFGLSAGLGMLTKWTYFVFVAGPSVYLLWCSLRKPAPDAPPAARPVRNALGAALLGIVVASFWYIPNGGSLIGSLSSLAVGVTGANPTRFQQLGETIGPSGIFNLASFFYYSGQFVNYQANFATAVLLLAVSYPFLKNTRKDSIWILALWILVPVILFTLIKNKTPRNTIPVLPAVGLVLSMGVLSIRSMVLQKSAVALVFLMALLQFGATSYGSRLLPAKLSVATPLGEIIFFQQHNNFSYTLYHADSRDWKTDEILDTIYASSGDRRSVDIVLAPRDAFTWMSLEYTSYMRRLPFKFIGAVDDPDSVRRADFVLLKTGGLAGPWFGMSNIHKATDLLVEAPDQYSLLKSVQLPGEESTLSIYDTYESRRARLRGVVFADSIEVVDSSVTPTDRGDDVTLLIACTLRSHRNTESALNPVFLVFDKRSKVLSRTIAQSVPPLAYLTQGEMRNVTADVSIPGDVARDYFSVEMALHDATTSRPLTYYPRYLIYKRVVAAGTGQQPEQR